MSENFDDFDQLIAYHVELIFVETSVCLVKFTVKFVYRKRLKQKNQETLKICKTFEIGKTFDFRKTFEIYRMFKICKTFKTGKTFKNCKNCPGQ